MEEERATERAALDKVRGALVERGLLAPDADVEEQVVALHRYLCQTPSKMLGVALADLVGDRRIINQPGTNDEYPNWRIPLAGPDDRPVTLGGRGPRAAGAPARRGDARRLSRGLPVDPGPVLSPGTWEFVGEDLIDLFIYSDSSGRYEVKGLPAGVYRLEFLDIHHKYPVEFWKDKATLQTATDIVLGPAADVGQHQPDARGRRGGARTAGAAGRRAQVEAEDQGHGAGR